MMFQTGKWDPPASKTVCPMRVSLTSWAPRLPDLPLVLLTLIQQTVRPKEIIVWLTENDKRLLSPEVEQLFSPYGVKFSICDDLKSHKKWLPMIEEQSSEPFVICDDDIIYPRRWLANLVGEDRRDAFVGVRAHQVTFTADDKVESYSKWRKQIGSCKRPSESTFITGGAGAIIHPDRVLKEFCDRTSILRQCPTADDVWINVMHWASGYKCYKTKYSYPCLTLPSASRSALELHNVDGGANDVQISACSTHFERSQR
ncbi:MAG TPA: hypothetical protein VN673_10720 [Clostridia bacterium]|nr:hypothetical protein [Clostridia bacterium]